MKKVSLLFVGDEIVDGIVENTNLSVARRELELAGLRIEDVVEARDEVRMISEFLTFLLYYSDGVLLCGGLGSTEDDLTRDAVSYVTRRPLVFVPEIWADIEQKLRKRGVDIKDAHKRMAYIPKGAEYILNPVGLAPAFWLRHEDRIVAAFPAVPAEFEALLKKVVSLAFTGGRAFMKRLVFKLFGLRESEVNERAKRVLRPHPVKWGTVIRWGEVWLNVRCEPDVASRVEELLMGEFGVDLYGRDEDTLESVVGRLLKDKGLTLSVAESCTGGLLASMITDVSGSSDYFKGGVVAYLEEIKASILGVSWDSIKRCTVYSHQVAREMATGVKRLFSSHIGLSTTGIAGPTGGTPDKPVGLVYVGVAFGDTVKSFEFRFNYDRVGNKNAFARAALDVLRRELVS